MAKYKIKLEGTHTRQKSLLIVAENMTLALEQAFLLASAPEGDDDYEWDVTSAQKEPF